MCTTTSHYETHISTECSVGGNGQCDGYCVDHGSLCTCSCHNAWDLPETVTEVLVWHDDLNDVVYSTAESDAAIDYAKRWSVVTGENYYARHGQGRFVVVLNV